MTLILFILFCALIAIIPLSLIFQVQNICFELVSTIATRNFRLAWFKALLRQDSAFFDVRYEASGLASTIEPNSRKISFGLGKVSIRI